MNTRRRTSNPALALLDPLERRTLLSASITDLAVFNATSGTSPVGELVRDSGGNLYGLTSKGGAHGLGTIFEIRAGSKSITTLASFDGTNGRTPHAGLVRDSAGNLYGTTFFGGTSHDGNIFELKAGSHTITNLASFNGRNGSFPVGGLALDAAGNLYGTTRDGPSTGKGSIFKISVGSSSIVTLASFPHGGAAGESPAASVVVDNSGNLFGTTNRGAKFGVGAVWKLPAGSHTVTALAPLDGTGGTFLAQQGVTLDARGNLFGVTKTGGAAHLGSIWEIKSGTKSLTTLASFNGTNGHSPQARLLLDAAGNLYGTCGISGSSSWLSVFRLAAGSHTITTLVSGRSRNDRLEFDPSSGLTTDSSGNLYGTTLTISGAGGLVYKVSGSGFKYVSPHLVFANSVHNATAGTAISPAPKVWIEDYNNQIITSDGSRVTAKVNSGPGAVTVSVAAKYGVATFSKNLILTRAGRYTLAASSGSYSRAISNSFAVSPAAASKLVFTSVPASVQHGSLFSTRVAIEDQFGNVVTSGSSKVTLLLKSAPSGGALQGTTAVTSASGVAVFSNIKLSAAGSYVLEALDGGLAPALSTRVTAA